MAKEKKETSKKTNSSKDQQPDVMSFIVPRLEGLMDILGTLGKSSELMLNIGAVPYLFTNDNIFFTYIPIDITGDGQFILQISKTIREGSKTYDNILMDLETFNQSSELGFATMDMMTGDIILRAQIPEIGGISTEWYSFILEQFNYSASELNETLSENE